MCKALQSSARSTRAPCTSTTPASGPQQQWTHNSFGHKAQQPRNWRRAFISNKVAAKLRRCESKAPREGHLTYHHWRQVDLEGQFLQAVFSLPHILPQTELEVNADNPDLQAAATEEGCHSMTVDMSTDDYNMTYITVSAEYPVTKQRGISVGHDSTPLITSDNSNIMIEAHHHNTTRNSLRNAFRQAGKLGRVCDKCRHAAGDRGDTLGFTVFKLMLI
ncbi:hypothetical protein MTO96_037366 [Rhipicephalus appendiculatus]